MDLTGFMSMPTDQAVAQLMQAYPNVNPKPLVDSLAHLEQGSSSYIGAPAMGYEGSGNTPSGTIPGPAGPPAAILGGLAGGSLMPKAPAPVPLSPPHVPGVQPGPWTDPRTYHNPADQQIRKPGGTLGQMLGGLK